MRLRAIITVSISSLILIGCAAFPRHPDRKPTIWEVITAYTNPATSTPDVVASRRVSDEDSLGGANSDAEGTPTPTLLPGTRVSVAQTRVHSTRLAMTAEAAPPTPTLLPGTRVSVAQTRVHLTKLAMTATSVITGTSVTTATAASGTRVAVVPTQVQPTQVTTTPKSAGQTSTPRDSTPRPTPTERSVSTATPTASSTTPPTPAITPTRRVAPTPDAPPTSPPSPPEDPIRRAVYIRSHSGSANSGEFVVIGEIINGEDYPIYGARVVGAFHDASGALVGAQEEMAFFPKTHTEQSNPFRLAASDPAGNIESYELSLVWEDISIVDFAPLTVQGTEVNDEGTLEISGELKNDQSTEVTSIIVAVTFYDKEGAVVAAFDNFYGGQTLPPGDTMPYTLTSPNPNLEYDTFYVQAQANLNLY